MHKTANHNSTQYKINKRTYSDINLHVLHEDEIQHHGYNERRSVLRRGVPGVTSLCDSHKTLLAYDQEEALLLFLAIRRTPKASFLVWALCKVRHFDSARPNLGERVYGGKDIP